MYVAGGRDSVPPERLLKHRADGVLHGSERKAVLRAVGYNLLFRFDQSSFSKNRARLMQHHVAKLFFGQVIAQAQQARLMSSEYFSVDGTLIGRLRRSR
jgi:transposase